MPRGASTASWKWTVTPASSSQRSTSHYWGIHIRTRTGWKQNRHHAWTAETANVSLWWKKNKSKLLKNVLVKKREADEQGWCDCLELECIGSKGTCNGEKSADIWHVDSQQGKNTSGKNGLFSERLEHSLGWLQGQTILWLQLYV